MKNQKYDVGQYTIETILTWVNTDELAIPEIQRPFVWDSTKVRELMDSLYKGYPVGYLISWKDPTVRLKDGSKAEGKRILIDGQQRVASLMTAILGKEIIDKNYRKIKIQISFQPKDERFEVFNPAIQKDVSWVPDIAPIVNNTASIREITDNYCKKNKGTSIKEIDERLEKLRLIGKIQLGFIELQPGLDIETVTTIFERVNREGVKLNQADFVMSKIASYGTKGEGSDLRKCIDYFCHMTVSAEVYPQIIEFDKEFSKSTYMQKMKWLKNEKDELYDPVYGDLVRVAFMTKFQRGKLGDLVSLLSGRNFKTKEFEPRIKDESFRLLESGVLDFINETNFKRFLMIVKSDGFIDYDFIQSQNALNFAYVLYLRLKELKMNSSKIEKLVRKWFVMSLLTERYSGSSDSTLDADVKNITIDGIDNYLNTIEKTELSNAFWDVGLITGLGNYNINSPYLSVFFAAQIKENDKGFLSTDIAVRELVIEKGDIHHIFPKNYLRKNMKNRKDYNQLANLVYTQTEINVKIGDKSPKEYFSEVLKQCKGGKIKFGGINDMKILRKNLAQNCVPDSISDMDISDYDRFLEKRKKLMAQKIKKYYQAI